MKKLTLFVTPVYNNIYHISNKKMVV